MNPIHTLVEIVVEKIKSGECVVEEIFVSERGVVTFRGKFTEKWNVRLISAGTHQIQVIKAIRDITGATLKEAKDTIDGIVTFVVAGTSKERAERIQRMLESEGASVVVEQIS